MLLAYDRQLYETGIPSRVVDSFDRFSCGPPLSKEDIPHVTPKVAIVVRKPAWLHLYHDSVSGQEDMIEVEIVRIGVDSL